MAAPDMSVYEELSALENLHFFARLRGLAVADAFLRDLLVNLGLPAREQTRLVGTYSSGMKQRVKLAQAVLHEPPCSCFDEPSSNLDAAATRRWRGWWPLPPRAAVAVATNDPREIAWGDARIDLAL